MNSLYFYKRKNALLWKLGEILSSRLLVERYILLDLYVQIRNINQKCAIYQKESSFLRIVYMCDRMSHI